MLTSKIGVLCIARVVGMTDFAESFSVFVLSEHPLSCPLGLFS